MDKHTARAEGSQYIRHFVNGEQVACVAVPDWDDYVAGTWSLAPELVALRPDLIPNFPGDVSSGTPANLKSEMDANVEIAKEAPAA